MSIRGWGLAAAAALLVGAAGGTAVAAPPPTLLVTGQGGQSAVLTLGSGGVTLGYPFFQEPRVPGPVGAVGGVVIQRVGDPRLVGGTVLQNSPGFDRAIDIPLIDFEKTRLRPGRYRFTLLGSGPRSVHLEVRAGSAPRKLTTRGPAVPITRSVGGTGSPMDSWSEDLGRIQPGDYLLVGAGSGGDGQQGDESDQCVQSQASPAGDPCVGGQGIGLSPGAGGSASWSGSLYPPGDLEPGGYTYTGHVIGLGPGSVAGHGAVVISPRR